ncbi:MAG: flagellar hook-basal body protein [Planctomycetota bacterium]|nr:flagellar hook-basal body protein [Planctomycetota bacterium]
MIYGIYLSTMGALVQARRHDITANNLANVNTPGFKPDWAIFREVLAESLRQPGHRSEIDAILEKTGGGVWLDKTISNFKAGPLRLTGNPLDLALEDREAGKVSFFQVRKPDAAEVYYTRNGHFMLDQQRRLVTADGHLVLSPAGEPVVLPASGAFRINDDGAIFNEANEQVGQIGVVRTAEPNKLRKIGDSLFANPERAALAVDQRGIRAGVLEDSGANAIFEMVNMIEGHRLYEANMRFISIQDETLGQVVQRIAAVA